MKQLIRKLWTKIGQWLQVDYAELLELRERTVVSLERAKAEYEQTVEQAIKDGKFGNVWFGSNHMPDDDLENYILGFREQCGRSEFSTYVKDTAEGSPKAYSGELEVLFNKLLIPSKPRKQTVKSCKSDVLLPPKPKPLRCKVDGKWPIDTNVGAIHVSGACYTGDRLVEYVGGLNAPKTVAKPRVAKKTKRKSVKRKSVKPKKAA